METIVIIAMIAIIPAAVGFAISSHSKKTKQFIAAMESLNPDYGVVVTPGTWLKSAHGMGGTERLTMKIDIHQIDDIVTTRVRVEGNLPRDIYLSGEGMGTSLKKMFVGQDREVGDAAFDQAVYAKGEPTHLLSHMKSETRDAVSLAMQENTVFDDGVLQVSANGMITDREELARLVDAAMGMAQALEVTGPSEALRLAHIVRTDHDDIVRRRAFDALLETHHTDPAFAALCESIVTGAGSHDATDWHVFLTAAGIVGVSAREQVLALLHDTTARGPLRARALEWLNQYATTVEDMTAPVDVGLSDSAGAVVAAALRIARSREIEVPPETLDALMGHDHPGVRAGVAAATLVTLDDGTLARLHALAADADDETALTATESLAGVGTADSVPILVARAETFDAAGKKTVGTCVDAIQSRVAPGLRGGLAISQRGREGRLSPVRRPAGQLEGE